MSVAIVFTCAANVTSHIDSHPPAATFDCCSRPPGFGGAARPDRRATMATRCQFENSNEVGVFAKLTNAYAIIALGGSENFYSVFEAELADHIPVVKASIAGTRLVGRLTVGALHGMASCCACAGDVGVPCVSGTHTHVCPHAPSAVLPPRPAQATATACWCPTQQQTKVMQLSWLRLRPAGGCKRHHWGLTDVRHLLCPRQRAGAGVCFQGWLGLRALA